MKNIQRLGDHFLIENSPLDDIHFGLLGKILGTSEDVGQDIIIMEKAIDKDDESE